MEYLLASGYSSGTSVTFTGFPTTGNSIKIFVAGHTNRSSTDSQCWIRINGDASTNYSGFRFRQYGTIDFSYNTLSGGEQYSWVLPGSNASNSSLQSGATFFIPNYRNATMRKLVSISSGANMSASNNNFLSMESCIGLDSTNAITSMTLGSQTGDTLYLYYWIYVVAD